MTTTSENGGNGSPPRVDRDDTPAQVLTEDQPSPGLRNSRGWDGKLRVKRPSISNPEALSDPDYSDEENVLPGEVISADEGDLALRNL
jgi:protein phosphatase 1 regulatory subunit 7